MIKITFSQNMKKITLFNIVLVISGKKVYMIKITFSQNMKKITLFNIVLVISGNLTTCKLVLPMFS